jgi:predicted dehydrogenase
MSPVGIGIIGAGAWASLSHVPVIEASESFELRAVSTSRRSTADAAAATFGVRGYDSAQQLVEDPDVELVVVATRVAQHDESVRAVLRAGKAVYCEWPLTVGLAGAEQLAELARATGVRSVVGLQGRYAPEIRYAAQLLAEGYVGRVLGTTMVGSGMVWGGEVASPSQAYWFDDAQGATTLTSAALHALDPLHHLLGEFASLSANLVHGRKSATVVTGGSAIEVTAPDQITVIGTLASGAAASVFYRGGVSRGDNFRWEINGTDGDLVIASPWGNVQTAPLTLSGGRHQQSGVTALTVPEDYLVDVPEALRAGPAKALAQLYADLARDFAGATRTVPDLEHGVRRHILIDAIRRASASGTTQDFSSASAAVAS